MIWLRSTAEHTQKTLEVRTQHGGTELQSGTCQSLCQPQLLFSTSISEAELRSTFLTWCPVSLVNKDQLDNCIARLTSN